MEKFTKLTGVAAPLPMINVDTDMIIPKQFLKTIKRTGLGKNLFFEMRYDDDGAEIADFVLNKPAYRGAKILVAGDNFGCGSSREGAVYALVDAGIRVVVSTRIADIFRNNAVRNGLVPVELPAEDHAALADTIGRDPQAAVTVDLERGELAVGSLRLRIALDAASHRRLVLGLDDIGETERRLPDVKQAERRYQERRPWTVVSADAPCSGTGTAPA